MHKNVLAVVAALVVISPPKALAISLTFEGVFTSVDRVVDCPVTAGECSGYSTTEAVNVPVSSFLSFTLDPVQDPILFASEFLDGTTGRPLGMYSSNQAFRSSETFSEEFDQPLLIPEEYALPNPITLEYWNDNLEWPGTGYSELQHASLNQFLLQYEDIAEVVSMQSSWSVGQTQNWYVTEGPPYNNIQYVSGLLLQGNNDVALTPASIGQTYDNEAFVDFLLSSMQCGYCVSITGYNTVYDSQITGLMTSNTYYGLARLIAVDGQSVSVPEPSTNALFILGLVSTIFAARRRRAVS